MYPAVYADGIMCVVMIEFCRRNGGMNQRLYSDTAADFHTAGQINKKRMQYQQNMQYATEYGVTSHYKDFGAFLNSACICKST